MTARKPKAKRPAGRDPLAGYRNAPGIDDPERQDDDTVLPVALSELDVLDMAFETDAALKDLEGPLRYVLEQARDEARQANRALLRCDPFDTVTIQRLQEEWRRFDKLMQWVFSTLMAGHFIEQKHTEEQIDEARQLLNDAGQAD